MRLSARVIRVTAHNGSVMTGPGTNTYLVGGGAGQRVGGDRPRPARRRRTSTTCSPRRPGAIRWIFATHTHPDHSPATALLKARTGATVHGRIADHPEWQDASFAPEHAARRRRAHRARRRRHAARDPHAGPRVEPPVLPAGGREDALHRRPRDAALDRGHQPAGRRHGGLHRVAARAAAPRTSTGSRPATAS